MELERIQKILSSLGVCSRRKAEEYISQGRIKVNGEVVNELGYKCSLYDEICLDDKVVHTGEVKESKLIYLALNKPYGVVSTLDDPQGRKTVADFIPSSYGRLYPVGRLDFNSNGLIIMTNDGEFANLVTHPSSAPEKEYLVLVKNEAKGDEVERLAKGLYILKEGYTAAPCEARVIRSDDDSTLFDIILHEGKKREIRYMMDTLNHPVKILLRIRIGDILLGELKEGEYKEIDPEIIKKMKEECNQRKENNIYISDEELD